MITYTIATEEKKEEIQAMSLKKALRSFQTKAGNAKEVTVWWTSRKGNGAVKNFKLPIKKRKNKYE
tara:strand:+ start:226 stop:423 length:198 start_codon:yes stop_codon:yes gene_type:complete